jgi:hypothetical protein
MNNSGETGVGALARDADESSKRRSRAGFSRAAPGRWTKDLAGSGLGWSLGAGRLARFRAGNARRRKKSPLTSARAARGTPALRHALLDSFRSGGRGGSRDGGEGRHAQWRPFQRGPSGLSRPRRSISLLPCLQKTPARLACYPSTSASPLQSGLGSEPIICRVWRAEAAVRLGWPVISSSSHSIRSFRSF